MNFRLNRQNDVGHFLPSLELFMFLDQARYNLARANHFLRLNHSSLSWISEKKEWHRIPEDNSRKGKCSVDFFCSTRPQKSLLERVLEDPLGVD